MTNHVTLREMAALTRRLPVWARVRFILILVLIQSMQKSGYDVDLDEP